MHAVPGAGAIGEIPPTLKDNIEHAIEQLRLKTKFSLKHGLRHRGRCVPRFEILEGRPSKNVVTLETHHLFVF